MGIIGDIEGKTCIINDDMIDTAGTLCASVRELKKMGAGDIYVCATHGIFSGPAIERLNDAPIVECVVDRGRVRRGERLQARRRRLRDVRHPQSQRLQNRGRGICRGPYFVFRATFFNKSNYFWQLFQL